MKKSEATFGVLFRHWIRANPPKETMHFELKESKGKDSILFSAVEDHQVVFGEAIRDSTKGVLMRNMGGNGEPDYSYLYRDPVFIAIRFPGFFCIIQLAVFVREKATSPRKSLTAQRARAIAQQVIELKQ